jgi:hypothetical protein
MPVHIPTDTRSLVRARSAVAQNLIAFLTSLTFHAAVVGAGLLTYQSVKAWIRPQQMQITVADTPLVIEAITTDLNDKFQRTPNDERRIRPQDQVVDPTWVTNHSSFTRATQAVEETAAAELSSGIGPSGASRVNHGPGSDTGESGSGSAFGIPQRGGGSNIFGPAIARSAHSVAFLCDASGSMLTKFAALRRELDDAVVRLRPVQSFAITFFGDNRANSLSPQLLMATPANKVRATNFLENVTPRGITDPLPALELAFKQKPELIFLLTDGDFPDNQVVLNRIRQLNRDKAVKINTIAFVGQGDTDTAFISLLQQIARENGGTFKHVTQDQLP